MNFIVGILLSLAALFGYHQPTQVNSPTVFGAVNPVQGTSFFLSGAGITATQNTIQLTSFQTPDGRNLTMTNFGTLGYGALEPGTSKLEDVTFTGITQNSNGTATLTGVTRGNDFVSPYAASTTLAKAHAGGSTFILTNTAGFYTQFASVNNANTFSGVNTFSSTTPPRYDQPGAQAAGNFIATTSEFASVAYVNAISFAGTTNANTTTKGIVQIATAAQTAAGTASGSTGAALVPANSTFNTTQSATTLVPVTNSSGKISQLFLDLTQDFVTSGAWTIAASASKKLTLNSVSYVFPSSQGASSTAMLNDGSGNLSNARVQTGQTLCSDGATYSTQSTGAVVLKTCVIPAGAMSTNDMVKITALMKQVGGANTMTGSIAIGNGTASTTVVPGAAVSNNGLITVSIMNLNSLSAQESEAITSNGTVNTVQESSPAVNMANQWYISFSGLVANASDTFNYKGISVVVQR